MTVREIYDAIDRIAPFQTAMDFDNVGILIGDENADVTKTLLCLDVTPRVLREAKSIGVELIISHHPVIFKCCLFQQELHQESYYQVYFLYLL